MMVARAAAAAPPVTPSVAETAAPAGRTAVARLASSRTVCAPRVTPIPPH